MSSRAKPLIFVVENATKSAQPLIDCFASDYSIATTEAKEHAVATSEAQHQRPDLIILHVDNPEKNELLMCQALREKDETKATPIFVLSGRTETKTKVGAFLMGADDFLEHPFSPDELKARVGARLRSWKPESLQRSASLEINPSSMSVSVKGKNVAFSLLEFYLLKFFLENEGRLIKREEILESVWKGQEVKSRTVDTHLVSIRKKIRGSGVEISSLYGAGYTLRKKRT